MDNADHLWYWAHWQLAQDVFEELGILTQDLFEEVAWPPRHLKLFLEESEVGQQHVERLNDVDLVVGSNIVKKKPDEDGDVPQVVGCADQQNGKAKVRPEKSRKSVLQHSATQIKPIADEL